MMIWRNEKIEKANPGFQRPGYHILDTFMLCSKQTSEQFNKSKSVVQEFELHSPDIIQAFLTNLNSIAGKVTYVSSELLCRLGIVLNVEAGYLIHINSTENMNKNVRFDLATTINKTLKAIIDKCDFGGESAYQLSIIKKEVVNLFKKNHISISTNDYKPRFNMTYNLNLDESFTIKQERKLGYVDVYQAPEPCLSVIRCFKCDICLKAYASIGRVEDHLRQQHNIYSAKAKAFVSRDYCQNTPKGLVSVLVTKSFVKQDIKEEVSDKVNIKDCFNCTGFKIEQVSSSDQMCTSEYVQAFWRSLNLRDIQFYLEYPMIDAEYCKMEKYLTNVYIQVLVQLSRTRVDTSLKVMTESILKFYQTANTESHFKFTKLTSFKKIVKYASIFARSMMVLIFSSDAMKQRVNKCYLPATEIVFTSSQHKILDAIVEFVSDNYKKNYAPFTDPGLAVVLEPSILAFWNQTCQLMLDVTLQPQAEKTPLQFVFSFLPCSYDSLNKKLRFQQPLKRMEIYKAILYFMRISILTLTNKENDEVICSLIESATLDGALREVIEKIYYPTSYSLITKNQPFEPFFNKEKLSYTHPVHIMKKTVGCKILGTYSLNLTLERNRAKLKAEYNFLNDPHLTYADIENSLQRFTSLMIDYLVLTNEPLSSLTDYFDLELKHVKAVAHHIVIKISSGRELIILEKEIIDYFNHFIFMKKNYMRYGSTNRINLLFLESNPDTADHFFGENSVRTSTYQQYYNYLTACHETIGRRSDHHIHWLEMIKRGLRIRGESYLLLDLQSSLPENQYYIISESDEDEQSSTSYVNIDQLIHYDKLVQNSHVYSDGMHDNNTHRLVYEDEPVLKKLKSF